MIPFRYFGHYVGLLSALHCRGIRPFWVGSPSPRAMRVWEGCVCQVSLLCAGVWVAFPCPSLHPQYIGISHSLGSDKCHVFDYYIVMYFSITLHYLLRTVRIDISSISTMRSLLFIIVQTPLHIIYYYSHRQSTIV